MPYVFGGLPGTGKATLASRLSQAVRALYLRLDVVEHTLRRVTRWTDGPEGYAILYDLADANLCRGLDVVADTVNPVAVTRDPWRSVANATGVGCVEIEVVCSDVREPRRRVTMRPTDIAGFSVPTWEDVVLREYESWFEEHIVLDTANRTPLESFADLERAVMKNLEGRRNGQRNRAGWQPRDPSI